MHYYEICFDKNYKMVPSPYASNWQMSREPFSVAIFPTNSELWIPQYGISSKMFCYLKWCEENNIKICDVVKQDYIMSYEGYEYKPIPGKRLSVYEIRFFNKNDAMNFKLRWS